MKNGPRFVMSFAIVYVVLTLTGSLAALGYGALKRSGALEIELSMPVLPIPDISMAEFEMPTLAWPQLPVISWPDIAFDFEWPQMQGLEIQFPSRDLAALVIKPDDEKLAFALAATEPASGEEGPAANSAYLYDLEEQEISVDAVLVPKKSTVLSSSRDGQITAIHFENGDVFKKGDVLVEYDCRDIEAELAARESEESLTRQKSLRSAKLLKLEIISNIENLTLNTEQKKAEAMKEAIQQRVDSCYIRAAYDGRVTNRLANPGEYTRTDRVLMEISSLDDLEAEFLMPSRWLRWVNTGASVDINLVETGGSYKARIRRIHGEVDPSSQSIQMTAELEPYDAPLLPGMSGEVIVNAARIRDEGISGYLETGRKNQE